MSRTKAIMRVYRYQKSKKPKILNKEVLIEDLIKIYKSFTSNDDADKRKRQIKKLNGKLIYKLANYLNIDYYVMLISKVFYDKDKDVFSEIQKVFTFYSYKITFKVYNEIIIKNNDKFKQLYNSDQKELKERLSMLNSSILINTFDDKYRFLLNNNNELILFNRKNKQWYGNKIYPLSLLNFKFQKGEEKVKEESSYENELYPFISMMVNDENIIGEFEINQHREYKKLSNKIMGEMYGQVREIGEYFDYFGYDYDILDTLKKDMDYNDSSLTLLRRKRMEEKLKLENKNRDDLSSTSTLPPSSSNFQFKLSDTILKEILFKLVQFKKASHQQIKYIETNSTTTTTLRNLSLVSKQFFKVISNILDSNYYEWNKSTINFGKSQFSIFQNPPLFFDYDSIITIPYDIDDEKLQTLFSRVETFHYNCDGFLLDHHLRRGYDDGYSDCEDKKVDKALKVDGYFIYPPLNIPLLKNLYINSFGDYNQRSNSSYITFTTNLLSRYSKSVEFLSIEFFSISKQVIKEVLVIQGENQISLKTLQILTRDNIYLFKLLNNLYELFEELEKLYNFENLRIEIVDDDHGVFIENWNPFYDISKDEINFKRLTQYKRPVDIKNIPKSKKIATYQIKQMMDNI